MFIWKALAHHNAINVHPSSASFFFLSLALSYLYSIQCQWISVSVPVWQAPKCVDNRIGSPIEMIETWTVQYTCMLFHSTRQDNNEFIWKKHVHCQGYASVQQKSTLLLYQPTPTSFSRARMVSQWVDNCSWSWMPTYSEYNRQSASSCSHWELSSLHIKGNSSRVSSMPIQNILDNDGVLVTAFNPSASAPRYLIST